MPISLMLVTNIIGYLWSHTLPHVVACENTCAHAQKRSALHILTCVHIFCTWWSQSLLVVSAKLCFLYLGSSAAYWKFLPMLGPVADIQLSAPTEHEEKDVDLVEERKILFFLEAICGFKSIGVELSGSDVMDLEKWPLIQVYGIEELGGLSAPTLAGACMMVIAVFCRLMCAAVVAGLWRRAGLLHHAP
jgi:hypothetical protein